MSMASQQQWQATPPAAAAAASLTLDRLPPGEVGRVCALTAGGLTRRRLLDLGLVPGAEVEVVMSSPLGDPRAYRVRGAVIALRHSDAAGIAVEPAGARNE
jgi:ferrous iron transport protein A